MTYEDLKRRITEVLSEPDTALAKVGPLLDEVKVDYDNFITASESLKKSQERVRDLQDTNMKLFLAQTGQVNDSSNDEEELTGQDARDAFVAKLMKEEN